MSLDRNRKLLLAGAGALALFGALGWAIQDQRESIARAEDEVTRLTTEVATARRTIESTPEKEREVIVLRELDPVFAQILPDSTEVSQLLRQFYQYSAEAGIQLKEVQARPEPLRGKKPSDFSKASYTVGLEGDTFQFLEFLHRLETHQRFMAVPSFSLRSASRQQMEEEGSPAHRVQMDIETYIYAPSDLGNTARIDGYERKRDLLAGEINRRRQALSLSRFHYRGPRGRRDPWIDPRVPVADNPSGLSVPEQNAKVEELTVLLDRARSEWGEVQAAPDVLSRMLLRRDLMGTIALLQDGLLLIDEQGLVTFTPAAKRLDLEVREPLQALQLEIDETTYVEGPTREELEQVLSSMQAHLAAADYGLALAVFGEVADGLDLVAGDPPRELLAASLRILAEEASVLEEFEGLVLDFGGQALIQGRDAVVVLNGRNWSVGDVVPPGLEVLEIRSREVDFAFRGFVLTRRF